MCIYATILEKKKVNKKMFAVLIDPDKTDNKKMEEIVQSCVSSNVDFIFVGGSLLTDNSFSNCIEVLKETCNIPVVIFPGNTMQISEAADAILFLSLISGRNADMLIGKHVISAPILKKSGIEVVPTGYMLIESGKHTSAMYMSNTMPIPYEKNDIAACTAMAGEMLGLKAVFLDAGSGAYKHVSTSMISDVKSSIKIPLIVGGGIDSAHKASLVADAGADIIVVGNAIEKNSSLITDIAAAVHK